MKIAILSIQHTGSWTTIRLLERLTGNECLMSRDYEEGCSLFHAHIHAEGLPFKSIADYKKVNTWQAFDYCEERGYKMVVPLRDPLLSIITRQNRHPELDQGYIIDGFEALAGIDESRYHLLPIDLAKYAYQQKEATIRLCKYLGIEWEYVDWGVHNKGLDSTGLKAKYYAHDLKGMRDEIGGHIDRLLNNRIIHTFMRRHGYKLWWI